MHSSPLNKEEQLMFLTACLHSKGYAQSLVSSHNCLLWSAVIFTSILQIKPRVEDQPAQSCTANKQLRWDSPPAVWSRLDSLLATTFPEDVRGRCI